MNGVWASSVPPLCEVAVGAEYLIAGRVTVVLQPLVEAIAGTPADRLAMLSPVVVDVVEL
jgi:hypothetical protein